MRFLKYLLSVIGITALAALLVFCAYMIINSFTTHSDEDKIYGAITETADPVPVLDKKRGIFKDYYVVNYIQSLRVSYNYQGKAYTNLKDFIVKSEKYDTKPTTLAGKVYNTPYKAGNTIEIYVNKNNPDIFKLVGDASTSTVGIKSILYVAVPIYAVVILIHTISSISKGRKARKQAFMDKYISNRYQ